MFPYVPGWHEWKQLFRLFDDIRSWFIGQWGREGRDLLLPGENQGSKYPARRRAARRKFFAPPSEKIKVERIECEREARVVVSKVWSFDRQNQQHVETCEKHKCSRPIQSYWLRNSAVGRTSVSASPQGDPRAGSSWRTTNAFTSQFWPHLLIIDLRAFRPLNEPFMGVLCM